MKLNRSNRRELLVTGTRLSSFLAMYKLTSCGPTQGSLSNFYEGEKVTVKDMYTHDRGSRGFKGDVLKAEDIAKGEPVTLYLTEGNPNRGGHRHAFTLDKEHFKKLIKGEKVTMKTERASGHDHTVVVDPNYNPRNAKSVEIAANLFEDNKPEEPNPPQFPRNHELKLAIDDTEQPMIYLTSSQEITDGSAEYCIGSMQQCGTSQSIWQKMDLVNRLDQKRMYRLKQRLNQANDQTIHFRAVKQNGFMHRVIKLVKGG